MPSEQNDFYWSSAELYRMQFTYNLEWSCDCKKEYHEDDELIKQIEDHYYDA